MWYRVYMWYDKEIKLCHTLFSLIPPTFHRTYNVNAHVMALIIMWFTAATLINREITHIHVFELQSLLLFFTPFKFLINEVFTSLVSLTHIQSAGHCIEIKILRHISFVYPSTSSSGFSHIIYWLHHLSHHLSSSLATLVMFLISPCFLSSSWLMCVIVVCLHNRSFELLVTMTRSSRVKERRKISPSRIDTSMSSNSLRTDQSSSLIYLFINNQPHYDIYPQNVVYLSWRRLKIHIIYSCSCIITNYIHSMRFFLMQHHVAMWHL